MKTHGKIITIPSLGTGDEQRCWLLRRLATVARWKVEDLGWHRAIHESKTTEPPPEVEGRPTLDGSLMKNLGFGG